MSQSDDPHLVTRVEAQSIRNIWADGESRCAGVAAEPLSAQDLPDDCEIDSQREVGSGNYRFVLVDIADA